AEMLATIEGAVFVTRVAVNNPANMAKAKTAIRKAFEVQVQGLGVSIVEVLSTCPTNWGMNAVDATTWLEDNMVPYFPLGQLRLPAEVKA
ncbi:MAG: 2-oxoglutarate oxidoreductase, partial [Negativicutes bacterium]|nr:2-oxoglutarate oxidoreductase [Negativicutes bacterium]